MFYCTKYHKFGLDLVFSRRWFATGGNLYFAKTGDQLIVLASHVLIASKTTMSTHTNVLTGFCWTRYTILSYGVFYRMSHFCSSMKHGKFQTPNFQYPT